MTRSIAAALIGLLLVTACTDGAEPDGTPERHPDVICEGCSARGVVDFGVPGVGERVDRVVTLRNRGDAPALVRAIQASTVPPEFIVRPACTVHCGFHELAPGRTLDLTITYRPTEEGRAETTLALGPDGPNLRLVAEAGRIACTEALDFGSVVRGRERSLALDCENTTDSPRHVLLGQAIGLYAGEFQVEARTLDLAAFESVSTEVTFAPTDALGSRDVRLPVRVGGDEAREVVLSGMAVDRALQIPAAAAGCVELGFQQLGSRLSSSLEVVNVTHEPIPVAMAVGSGSDPAFSTSQEALQLEPGGRATLAFAFEPQEAGLAEAELQIEAGGVLYPVCVRGTGVGPTLSCDRDEVDFGLTDIATPRSMRLHCRNAAEDVAGTELDRLVIEGASSGMFAIVEPGGHPALGYAPGESFQLEVQYMPASTGVHTGAIRTNTPLETISLRGEARSYPDCTLEAGPIYNFGRVSADEVRHPFFLTNGGSGVCLVGDFQVTAGDMFSAEPERTSFEIAPGETAVVELTFRKGSSVGLVGGELAFWASDFSGKERTVALRANVGDSCLDVASTGLDFGDMLVGCTSRALEIPLRSTCASPIALERFEILGHTDAFSVHATQVDQPSSGGASLEVRAHPVGTMPRFGALRITMLGEADPIIVPLRVHATEDTVAVETHTLAHPAVDILLVIEDAGADTPEMWLHVDSFFEGLVGVDWQIGVTTTSISPGSANGRLVPVDGSSPRIITPALSETARKTALFTNASVGFLGDATEKPLAAMQLALSSPLIDQADDPTTPVPNDGNVGFLRRHADLAVVFLVEEDDSSLGEPTDYVGFLQGLKRGSATARMHLVPQMMWSVPTRLAQAVSATGGTVLDPVLYGPTPEFNEALVSAIEPRPAGCFHLRHPPVGGPGNGSVSLRLNGVALPATNATYPWFFNAGISEVCFSRLIPVIGSEVEITYTKACL